MLRRMVDASITGRSAKSQLVRVNVARPRKILKSGYACSMKKLAVSVLATPALEASTLCASGPSFS